MAELYQYVPLPGDDWIRLLHILPSKNRKSRLEAKLIPAQLSANPRYEALSYSWGNSTKPGSITMNDTRLSLTTNCASAIRNLRREAETRVMWIDAVSIDQNNTSERNKQVAMMGKIYALAHRTVVYLGPGDGTVRHLRSPSNLAGALFPSGDNAADNARGELLKRDWFRRKWIVQEVLLSRNLVVLCGRHEFSWAELEMLGRGSDIIRLTKTYSHPSSEEAKRNPNLKAHWDDMFEQGEVVAFNPTDRSTTHLSPEEKSRLQPLGFLTPSQLFDMLCATSSFECQEPKDRIYALLSLFAVRPEMGIHYEESDDAVYHRLTHDFIQMGDTRIFWLKERDSWIPRWAEILKVNYLRQFVYKRAKQKQKARRPANVGRNWGEVHHEQRLELRRSIRDRTLEITAISLGTVAMVAPQELDDHSIPADVIWESALKDLGLEKASYEDGMSPLACLHQRNRESLQWFQEWTLDVRDGQQTGEVTTNIKALEQAIPDHHGHITFCRGMHLLYCESSSQGETLVGLAPQTIRQDDVILFLPGTSCPFVVARLRAAHMKLVSLCWFGPLKLFPSIADKHLPIFVKQNWKTVTFG